jgi:MFS family permease
VGLGIGASAIVVPAYLAEIAPAAKRGAVVQTYEVRGAEACSL